MSLTKSLFYQITHLLVKKNLSEAPLNAKSSQEMANRLKRAHPYYETAYIPE
jgi:hypothetical protein